MLEFVMAIYNSICSVVIATSCSYIDARFKHPSVSDIHFVYNLVASNLSHQSLLPHLTLLAAGRGDIPTDRGIKKKKKKTTGARCT